MPTTTPRQHPGAGGPSKGRVESFSDGVFAVAITLLVLDITLDRSAGPGQLWSDLGELKYHYAAYAVSFLTIGITWVSHHHMMTAVATVDHGLLYRNLLLLAVVCFIPFPTSVLSRYVAGEGATDMRAAVGFYGITLTALSAAFLLLWVHLSRTPGIRAPGVVRGDVRADTLRAGGSLLVNVAATALTPLAPWITLAVFAAVAALYAVARPGPGTGQNLGGDD